MLGKARLVGFILDVVRECDALAVDRDVLRGGNDLVDRSSPQADVNR